LFATTVTASATVGMSWSGRESWTPNASHGIVYGTIVPI
jgi:hypothetical protein